MNHEGKCSITIFNQFFCLNYLNFIEKHKIYNILTTKIPCKVITLQGMKRVRLLVYHWKKSIPLSFIRASMKK